MTDEEKANEYTNSKGFGSDYNNITSSEANEEIKKAYLEGLTEGRKLGKEEQWKATEKAQKKTSATIRELKKEIKNLKKQASANLMDYLDEKKKLNEIKNYLAYDIPHELMNEATNKIWRIV